MKHLLSLLFVVLGSSLAQGGEHLGAVPGIPIVLEAGRYWDVSPSELAAALDVPQRSFVLVNVHIPYEGALSGTDAFIPYNAIEANLAALPEDKGAEIVLYCMSGRMSELAAATLVGLGYTNVKSLAGGMIAWKNAGLPLEDFDR